LPKTPLHFHKQPECWGCPRFAKALFYGSRRPSATIHLKKPQRTQKVGRAVPSAPHPAAFAGPSLPAPAFLRAHPDGVLLSIKLQPRASANEIGEPLGNELRVKVTAAPVDSAANEALIRLLAARLNCPCNHVELVRGHTSRHKIIKLHGITPQTVLAKLSRR